MKHRKKCSFKKRKGCKTYCRKKTCHHKSCCRKRSLNKRTHKIRSKYVMRGG